MRKQHGQPVEERKVLICRLSQLFAALFVSSFPSCSNLVTAFPCPFSLTLACVAGGIVRVRAVEFMCGWIFCWRHRRFPLARISKNRQLRRLRSRRFSLFLSASCIGAVLHANLDVVLRPALTLRIISVRGIIVTWLNSSFTSKHVSL